MNTIERREQIIDLLCREGAVSVNNLSERYAVSTVTIRNDLSYLEKKGCLLRSYGGAILNKQFAFDRPLQDKGRINYNVKNAIARQAAEMVEDGDRIILDSGSTTTQMVPYLHNKRNLIVMTNALNIAYDLVTNTDIEVMVVGGNVRKNAYSISGPTVEQHLRMYRFDKLFLGVDGFDVKAGITTPNVTEAYINRTMCEISQEIIAVTDSSKFDLKSFCMICEIERINSVVTDNQIPEHYQALLRERGVKVVIADSERKHSKIHQLS